MYKYIVDTNIFIDSFRGNVKSFKFIENNYTNIIVSYITLNELIQGASDKRD